MGLISNVLLANANLEEKKEPNCGERLRRQASRPERLTGAVLGLPLQTLAVGEGDDVGRGVDAAPGAAAPHALHGLAGAVGTAGAQGAGGLTGGGAPALWAPWERDGGKKGLRGGTGN